MAKTSFSVADLERYHGLKREERDLFDCVWRVEAEFEKLTQMKREYESASEEIKKELSDKFAALEACIQNTETTEKFFGNLGLKSSPKRNLGRSVCSTLVDSGTNDGR